MTSDGLTFRELSVVRKMPRRSVGGQGICEDRRHGWGLLPRMEVSTSAKLPHAEFFPPPPSPRGPSLLAHADG